MAKDYCNKNILILGGSFGIGEALCREFDKQQANIAIAARSKDKIQAIISELKGENHLAFGCDILHTDELNQLAQFIYQKWQKIDLIIFCVGAYQPMNIEDFNCSKAQHILDTNLGGMLGFMNVFLPHFKQYEIAQLAVISSVSGYFGMPNSLMYGASKAALSHLTESLYYELKKYQVKVQLINPGFVDTRLTQQNKFPMPGIISPEKAATIILSKLKKKKFEIIFPFAFAFAMKILSLLPYGLRHRLLRRLNN